jgi:23S rRNA pseudouridine2457 synthase
VLTDDGSLILRLTDPRYNHPKTYLAQVEGIAAAETLYPLQTKILLPGFQTKLVSVEVVPEPDLPPRSKPVRGYHPTTWIKIVLREGKKHEVRRLTAAVGLPTLRLVRVAIGPIGLGNLLPGEWRRLKRSEFSWIFE